MRTTSAVHFSCSKYFPLVLQQNQPFYCLTQIIHDVTNDERYRVMIQSTHEQSKKDRTFDKVNSSIPYVTTMMIKYVIMYTGKNESKSTIEI